MGKRIAVIGSGIAGLAAAWLLSARHQVTLIERNTYIGGHTNTIDVDEDGEKVPVDTGFIVYNERNYPLLTRLFKRLGVATRETDMSFAASVGPWTLEYAGSDLNTLFAQRRNLFSPAFLGMCRDILRFNSRCKSLLTAQDFGDETLGEFLDRERLGAAFRDHYLLPMAASIWSCPKDTMMQFPAASLARFYANHGLLNLVERPQWKTVTGGSQQYVRRMLSDMGTHRVIPGDGAKAVTRAEQGVTVQLHSGQEEGFDAAVLACHGDQALGLLAAPTEPERELLGAFSYQRNQVYLHTDDYLMPRSRRVWSAWNHLSRHADGDTAVSVTYWMNRLQGLASQQDYFVSLNPFAGPRPDRTLTSLVYEHPVFDQGAMAAQERLHEIQGRDRIWYCGSYFGYGFHEDALRAAVAVADDLGADVGWLTQPAAAPAATTAAEPSFVQVTS